MQLSSLTMSYTKNLGNYESARLEVTAAPSEGQDNISLFTEVEAFLVEQLEGANPTPKGAQPPQKTTPAKKTTTAKKGTKKTTAKKGTKKSPAKGGPDPEQFSKATGLDPDPDKALSRVKDSSTPEQFLKTFNELRLFVDFYPNVDEWNDIVTELADHYRALPKEGMDKEVKQEITAAFKAEKDYIANESQK